ncbi:hypothetical protein KAT36_02355 [Candidatus Pacearchaeota archaeon]|nr:hypothetical protein [Candidatus Pacearchaeota archaeon]
MKKENKKPKVVLSKLWAWIILVLLAILDASLDMIFANSQGLQGFFWKPIADFLGTIFFIIITSKGRFRALEITDATITPHVEFQELSHRASYYIF